MFDQDKFNSTQFKERTAEIPVPELKMFFDKEEKPIWVVKGLGANEFAVANKAMKDNQVFSELISAFTSENAKEKAEALKEMMGITSERVPDDVVRRISLLVSGSVNPECSQETAVRLGTTFPTVFYKLTNKILSLSGEGMVGE